MRRVSTKRKVRGKEKNYEDADSGDENIPSGSEKSTNDEKESSETYEPEVKRKKGKKKEKGSSKVENNSEVNEESTHESEKDEEYKPLVKKSNKKGKKIKRAAKKAGKEVQKSEDDSENDRTSKNGTENNENATDDEDYEVEDIIDEKREGGQRYYLIRWKGFDSSNDTWEPASTLSCPDLMKKFQKQKKNNKKKKGPEQKEDDENWDETEEFEVDKIVEVHHRKDGKREFLVSWKGYPATQNTWEPEENLNCKELIDKFMRRVNQLKNLNQPQLRQKPTHTQRFTSNSYERQRRLSKRHSGKQRVQYFDAE